MIPVLVAAGHRVVVPDLVGFGRSDKPTRDVGLHLRPPRGMDERAAVRPPRPGATSRSSVRTGEASSVSAWWPRHPTATPVSWWATPACPSATASSARPSCRGRSSAASRPCSRSARIVNGGSATDLSPEVIAAYDAPFPDDAYKAGARIFPSLVPSQPDDPASADNARGVGGARAVREAVAVRVQRSGRRSREAAKARSSDRCPVPRTSRTPPSSAVATSSRRTRAPSWRP